MKENNIHILLNVTQSIVYEDLEIEKWGIDFVVRTCHKTLLCPSGIVLLYGIKSKNNFPLLCREGVLVILHLCLFTYIGKIGVKNIRKRSREILLFTQNELEKIECIKIYGTKDLNKKIPIISFCMVGSLQSELAYIYLKKWGIVLRSGIHCAPWVHNTIGTLPTGTVRVSIGNYTTKSDIEHFINATKNIISRGECAKVSA